MSSYRKRLVKKLIYAWRKKNTSSTIILSISPNVGAISRNSFYHNFTAKQFFSAFLLAQVYCRKNRPQNKSLAKDFLNKKMMQKLKTTTVENFCSFISLVIFIFYLFSLRGRTVHQIGAQFFVWVPDTSL